VEQGQQRRHRLILPRAERFPDVDRLTQQGDEERPHVVGRRVIPRAHPGRQDERGQPDAAGELFQLVGQTRFALDAHRAARQALQGDRRIREHL
jgi:hypothetical protein